MGTTPLDPWLFDTSRKHGKATTLSPTQYLFLEVCGSIGFVLKTLKWGEGECKSELLLAKLVEIS